MQALLIFGYFLWRVFRVVLAIVLAVGLVGAGLVAFFFMKGAPYPVLAGDPVMAGDALEKVLEVPAPPGNIAVGPDGRLFFTLHPAGDPGAARLMEWTGSEAVPFPSAEAQAGLRAPLGLALDGQGRLWVADGDGHGFGAARVLAFDVGTGELVQEFELPGDVAPWGSYLVDLAVDEAGEWIYVADAGVLARRPGLIVYNARDRRARRVLSRHATMMPLDHVIVSDGREMAWAGGAVSLKVGLAGLALGAGDEMLYFAPMGGDLVYRLPTTALKQWQMPDPQLAALVEPVGQKPLSEGIAVTGDAGAETVYVTDIENGAVHRIDYEGTRETLLMDERLRWAADLAVAPDGSLYLADSALGEVLGADGAPPYAVWRFAPPPAPVPPPPEEDETTETEAAQ